MHRFVGSDDFGALHVRDRERQHHEDVDLARRGPFLERRTHVRMEGRDDGSLEERALRAGYADGDSFRLPGYYSPEWRLRREGRGEGENADESFEARHLSGL